MKVNKIIGEGAVAYDVIGLTPLEMHELCVMRKRIYQVLESHHEDSKKKRTVYW